MSTMFGVLMSGVSSVATALSRVSGTGRSEEGIKDRPMLQHYGFASRPKDGAMSVALKEGNNILIVADDDARYRVALEEGEVALYTDQGDMIKIKRGGTIEITASTKVSINNGALEVDA